MPNRLFSVAFASLGLLLAAPGGAIKAAAAPRLSASAGPGQGHAATLLVHRQRRGLRPGMAVVDRRGRRIGVILELHRRRDLEPAVLIDDNGARFTVRASELRLSRRNEEAVILLSASRLRTRGILNLD